VRWKNPLQDEVGLYEQLYDREVLARKPFFNVGAGDFRHPYWTNVDKSSDWYAAHAKGHRFIEHDLLQLRPLPIPDGAGQIVYTSHTLEHVSNEAARLFCHEAFRILGPQGLIRIVVPDVDLLFRAYRLGDRFFDPMVRMYDTADRARRVCLDRPASELSCQQRFLWRIATSVSIHHTGGARKRMTDQEVDEAFRSLPYEQALDLITSKCDLDVQRRYPGNHINWWSYAKVAAFLATAGFARIHRCAYGQSVSPLLRNTRLFDKTHPEMSLYVEAVKEADQPGRGCRQE
jgi:hypothetical protein